MCLKGQMKSDSAQSQMKKRESKTYFSVKQLPQIHQKRIKQQNKQTKKNTMTKNTTHKPVNPSVN